jgi:arylsulfatase
VDRHRLPIAQPRAIVDTPVDPRDATRPEPAARLRPPEQAPNVLVILIDDMGFGASSAFRWSM